jgi:hypothetical protein
MLYSLVFHSRFKEKFRLHVQFDTSSASTLLWNIIKVSNKLHVFTPYTAIFFSLTRSILSQITSVGFILILSFHVRHSLSIEIFPSKYLYSFLLFCKHTNSACFIQFVYLVNNIRLPTHCGPFPFMT